MQAPRPSDSHQAAEAVTHCQANVAFWQQMSARLERDRHNLIFILYAVIPVAALVQLLVKMPLLALAAGGACASAWGLGMYMVTVRRGEYEFATAEANRELQAALEAAPKTAPSPQANSPT